MSFGTIRELAGSSRMWYSGTDYSIGGFGFGKEIWTTNLTRLALRDNIGGSTQDIGQKWQIDVGDSSFP